MIEAIKRFIKLHPFGKYFMAAQTLLRHSLSREGWNKSILKAKPIDSQGNPIPWFTYSSIYFLKDRIQPSFSVFEYGSGNSTLWFRERVERIVSVEHDASWYEYIKSELQKYPNIEYLKRDLESGAYEKEVLAYEDAFDVIVIDGRNRVACAHNALKALKKDGVIIWDNSEREAYLPGMEFLSSNNFKRLDLWGLGPLDAYFWCTTVFYKSDNCLNI